MSMRQIRKRVEKVEGKVSPKDGRTFTLEELHRLMWRADKRKYLEMANGELCSMQAFVPQFEREDAERLAAFPIKPANPEA